MCLFVERRLGIQLGTMEGGESERKRFVKKKENFSFFTCFFLSKEQLIKAHTEDAHRFRREKEQMEDNVQELNVQIRRFEEQQEQVREWEYKYGK